MNPGTAMGNGTFGYCPCRMDEEGDPRFFAIGHHGATTVVAYAPTLDMTIAVDLVDSLWEDDRLASVEWLFEMIEGLAANS